jgi:hypothetical protein
VSSMDAVVAGLGRYPDLGKDKQRGQKSPMQSGGSWFIPHGRSQVTHSCVQRRYQPRP